MTLLDICQAIQDSAIGTSIRESIWTFPLIETVHVIGLGISVGILVLLDLRLVGAGIRHSSPSQIIQQLKGWYLGGFAAMIVSGLLLFWSEAARAYVSTTFRIKILFLVLSGINAAYYEFKYLPRSAGWDETGIIPKGAKMVGWFSLICWLVVIGFGRWTAYGMK
jgi:hypothetical protein